MNASNHEGRTALHLAASTGNVELCIVLCTRGANINPLMLYKVLYIVSLFDQISPAFKDVLCTPLDLAIRKKHTVCIDYLTHRHNATKADQMTEQAIESKTRIQQQIAQG